MKDIQLIVDTIETALATKATTVGVWMDTVYEDGDYPVINIRDIEDEQQTEMVGSELRILTVDIDIVTSSGANTMKDIRSKRKEVVALVKALDFEEVNYIGSKNATQNEGKKLGGTTLRFEVVYETDEFI